MRQGVTNTGSSPPVMASESSRALGAAELGQDRVGEVRAHVSAMILVSVAIRSCGQVMCGLWLASIS